MPDPTPTTDTGGKKLNKTGVILIVAGGAVIAYLIYKKKQESAGSNPYTSQAFIPVTGENVAGAGAPFTGSSGGSAGSSGEFINALEQAQKENQENVTNFLRANQEAERENRRSERELISGIIDKLTGGGAPSSGQIGTNGGTASPASGGTPESKPVPPSSTTASATAQKPQPSSGSHCPGSHPYQGSHGCYQNIRCGNGCAGHRYQNGTVECQRGESKRGNCHW
jgi:hypothetical protein